MVVIQGGEKKERERAVLTKEGGVRMAWSCLPRGRVLLGNGNIVTEREPLMNEYPRGSPVRTWQGTIQARGMHFLEATERRTCQKMEEKRLSEGHSSTGQIYVE